MSSAECRIRRLDAARVIMLYDFEYGYKDTHGQMQLFPRSAADREIGHLLILMCKKHGRRVSPAFYKENRKIGKQKQIHTIPFPM